MSTIASRPRVLVAWSSGKDSAWTLHLLREGFVFADLLPEKA